MRPEGIARMGYYPTPVSMTAKIVSRLQYEGPARLFDPCAGEGDALAHIARFAPESSETYGIELDGYRAEKAQEKLTKVVACGYEVARVEEASMNLLFLNPPYDDQGGLSGFGSRKEFIFLRDLSKQLAPNGVLVFVIPRYVISPEMVNALLHRYNHLSVYRFDDREYQIYKQVVIFGRRRAKSLSSFKELSEQDRVARNELLAYGREDEETLPMPTLDESDGRVWVVPKSEMPPLLFRGSLHDPKELLADLNQSEVFDIATNLLNSTIASTTLHKPLLPFRRTHMATLISAGALNGAVGIGAKRHMVVGITRKVIETETVKDDKGNETVIDSEKYVTAVRLIEPTGTILELQ